MGISFQMSVNTLYYHCTMIIYANFAVTIALAAAYGLRIFVFVLIELYIGRKVRNPYRKSNSLRKLHNTIIEYRCTQILLEQFMSIYGFLLVPTHSLMTKLVLFCNYLAIRRNEMHISVVGMLAVWSIFCSLFWAILLQIGGYAHLSRKNVFYSWKVFDWDYSKNNKLMARFRRSCKPFMFN